MSIDRFLHPAVLQPGFLFYVRLAALVFALSFKTVTGQAVLNPDLPLQISNLEVQLLSNGRTAITWQTNKSSQAEVSYGLQGLETTISSDGWYKDEAVILADLLPDRLYHYKVVVQTATGEQAASPHLLFWSHHQADLAVADLNWLPEAISYQGYKPNLSHNTFTSRPRFCSSRFLVRDFSCNPTIASMCSASSGRNTVTSSKRFNSSG